MSPLLKTLWNSENNKKQISVLLKSKFQPDVFVSNELKFWMTAHAIWVTRWLLMAASAENSDSQNFVESKIESQSFTRWVNCVNEHQDAPKFFQLKSCPNMSLVHKWIKLSSVRFRFSDAVHCTKGEFRNQYFSFNIIWAGTLKELHNVFKYEQVSSCRKIDPVLAVWLHPAEEVCPSLQSL